MFFVSVVGNVGKEEGARSTATFQKFLLLGREAIAAAE